MREKAILYYRQGFNCSQCIIKSAETHFKLQINKQCFDMCSVINTGFGSGLMCSVLVAGIMVFGLMFDEMTAKRLRLQFLERFKDTHKTFDCSYLIKDRKRNGTCEELIGNAAQMIQYIIENELERK